MLVLKNFLFLHLIALYPCLLHAVILDNPRAKLLVTEKQEPTAVINTIAQLTDIEDGLSLKQLVEKTQKEATLWKRPAQTERNALKPVFAQKKDKLMQSFKRLEMSKPVYPKGKNFRYALLLGATAKGMVARFTFLENLCKEEKIKIKELVLLTGKRLVNVADAQEEEYLHNYFDDTTHLKTETDIAYALLLETDLFPHLKKISAIHTTDAAAETGDSRPRTANTIVDWLAAKPLPGACLAISSNPYIGYQDATLRTLLPETFSLETCGPRDERIETSTGIALCLDSLARWLYQHDKWIEEVKKLKNEKLTKS